ncbi:MAG: sensor domain-containing diguanylate cyclase [Myxococcota bacterium]|nr:sensor domain-containing diguanylate cyclase [Myxococcota bacterium]
MNKWPLRLQAAWSTVEPWSLIGIGLLGVLAHVFGLFTKGQLGLAALSVGVLLSVGSTIDIRNRLDKTKNHRPYLNYEGPLLWVVTLWSVSAVLGAGRGEVFVFSVALVSWIFATQSRQSRTTALIAAVGLELAFVFNGVNGIENVLIRLSAIAFGCLALERFASAEAFRTRLGELREQHDREAIQTERARDFGLLTAQAPILDALPALGGMNSSNEQNALEFLDDSFGATLEALRLSLDATSAVILWRSTNGFTKSAHSSVRTDVMDGPFHIGKGLPASVQGEVREVALEHVRENYEGLPYYVKPGGVGSAFALAIGAAEGDGAPPLGVLCVDRVASGEWAENDRTILRKIARKIELDVKTSQRLKAAENEKSMVRRFCAALGELNKSLGIDGTAQSTFEAVQEMANADLMVITLAGDKGHRVVAARGVNAQHLLHMTFDGRECLVGKAIEVRQTLPLSGRYRGHGTVFGPGEAISDMQSLMVIPLVLPSETAARAAEGRSEQSAVPVVGALTVAARRADAFHSPAREMIQLIARQVAIKLDLADAHEQIREMAKTDSMTGLANERSFDHAFSNMLSRAARRNDSLCLIMTDIDKFKVLNDTYGHPFGDEVIKAVARCLQNAIRSVDLAARIGGEEFALLLEDTDRDGAFELAERIRKEIQDMVLHHREKGPVQLTLSMGIAEFPSAGLDQPQLMEMADKALYLAKNSGRNQVRLWSELENVHAEQVARTAVRH